MAHPLPEVPELSQREVFTVVPPYTNPAWSDPILSTFLTHESSSSPISSAEQPGGEITSTLGSKKVKPLLDVNDAVCRSESSRNLRPPEVARRADAENGCEKCSGLERSCPSHGAWIVTCNLEVI